MKSQSLRASCSFDGVDSLLGHHLVTSLPLDLVLEFSTVYLDSEESFTFLCCLDKSDGTNEVVSWLNRLLQNNLACLRMHPSFEHLSQICD